MERTQVKRRAEKYDFREASKKPMDRRSDVANGPFWWCKPANSSQRPFARAPPVT